MANNVASPDRVETHFEWRQKVARHLPAVASRVFALQGQMYMGCGFHYGMVRTLGRIMASANTYDEVPTLSNILIEPVIWEKFLRDLIRAEFSARGWDFPDRSMRRAA